MNPYMYIALIILTVVAITFAFYHYSQRLKADAARAIAYGQDLEARAVEHFKRGFEYGTSTAKGALEKAVRKDLNGDVKIGPG